jgi:hypothetical protein
MLNSYKIVNLFEKKLSLLYKGYSGIDNGEEE